MYDTTSKRDGRFLTVADDSRIPHGVRIRALKSGSVSYKRWFFPIQWGHLTLREAYAYMTIVGAPQGKIPDVIRWTEGKDSHLVKQFFYGGVDLRAHDYVHILLGRGLLPKDEAFVIGFTMGTTNRLDSMNEDVFAYIAKHYYPNAYRMDDASKQVFMDASKMGYITDCPPLDEVDFEPLLDLTVDEVRKRLNIQVDLIRDYYTEIEQRRYPSDPASARLVDPQAKAQGSWQFKVCDPSETVAEAVAIADKALEATDIGCELDAQAFSEHLENAYQLIKTHLQKKRSLAQECFEEINKVLNYEDPLAQADVDNARWENFYQSAIENVDKSRRLVAREVHHASWEGYETESSELRTYIHALLGRGGSPRDRAFCRGFFHGTSNRRTTYASLLKLNLMAELSISRDGLYSEDMIQTYQDAARLGFIADCTPMAEVDFESLNSCSLSEARKQLNIPCSLLDSYQKSVEANRMLL
ncbi:MAG: hypothetical protein ACSHYA_04900 [Opitutaceae bacterium]